MTGSDSQAWVMLRIGRSAVQSHKRKEPVNEESKVCRFGCPCRDDCGGGSGAERGGEVARGHSESSGFGSEAGNQPGAGGGAHGFAMMPGRQGTWRTPNCPPYR